MPPEATQLLIFGCNHQRTPLEVREQMALDEAGADSLSKALAQHPEIRESALLNTCNRVELYLVTTAALKREELAAEIAAASGFPALGILEYAYELLNREAIEHAFKVASGLDSQMIGETEILGQMKAAYAEAQSRESIGPQLHRLFQKSFQAAKWARTETRIGTGQVSIGNIAVELAARIYGRLSISRTLVVGSGKVGSEVAKAFRSRGVACMSIASRTPERAEKLSREVDGLLIPFKTWADSLPYVDIGIFATAASEPILTVEMLQRTLAKRPHRPLFLIDLALPRDIDAPVADIENVYLYNLEDLAAIANENLRSRQMEVDYCLKHLRSRAEHTAQRMELT
jgi:glutamyl-tRNA reductase